MSETPEQTSITSAPEPGAPAKTAATGEEQALAAAKDLVDKGAPWRAGMSWTVVLIEGIVLAVAGAVIWLAPGFGARAVLQVMGVILLVTAAVSAWRVLRNQVAPERLGNVAFRAGVGLSVGLIVVIGSLITESTDTATVALAIVLGIGLILYGLAAIVAAFARREAGSRFPVVALVIAVLTLVVGALLVLNGRGGIESLQSTFTILGIVLLVAGVALGGYALMLRSRDQVEPAD